MSETNKPAWVRPANWTHTGDRVLILKAVGANREAYNGFTWPESGWVECPNWRADRRCGGGLHGWPWGLGIGDGKEIRFATDKWIVFAAAPGDVAGPLDGGWKCKARKGEVIYCGDFAGAWALVVGGRESLIGAMATQSGHGARATTAGFGAHAATAGFGAHAATAGFGAHASTAGLGAHASTAGDYATAATAGNYANASTAGNYARAATAVDYANASTAGNYAHASTAGDYANASTAGDYANASTAGLDSTACCLGLRSQASAGENGSIILTWHDGSRRRHVVAYVGENGIKPHVVYTLSDQGEIVEVT